MENILNIRKPLRNRIPKIYRVKMVKIPKKYFKNIPFRFKNKPEFSKKKFKKK